METTEKTLFGWLSLLCVLQSTMVVEAELSLLEKVNIEAFASCSPAQSSIVVNSEELLTSNQYGLYVLTITTTTTNNNNNNGQNDEQMQNKITTNLKRFYKPMKSNFFEYFNRISNRNQFTGYFRPGGGLENGTVIMFLTSGLCKRNSFGDWLEFLKKTNTELVFTEGAGDDVDGDSSSSIVVACVTKCPEGVNPKSVFSYDAALELTIVAKGDTNRDLSKTGTENSSPMIYSIIGIIVALIFLATAIFVFIFVYRRYYRQPTTKKKVPRTETTRVAPPTATTETTVVALGTPGSNNWYEGTEYQSVPERSSSNSSNEERTSAATAKHHHYQQHQEHQENYQDLRRGSSFKTVISQSSRLSSSTKSNTYQGLIGSLCDPEEGNCDDTIYDNDDDNIYAYIDDDNSDEHHNGLKPGTSFNLFKSSMENMNQDSTELDKTKFSSYITVSSDKQHHDKNNISADAQDTRVCTHNILYKKPSGVPKYMPPAVSNNNNTALEVDSNNGSFRSGHGTTTDQQAIYEEISMEIS